MFAARWGIQYLASRRAHRSVIPVSFWVASLCGSSILLVYFTVSPHRDPVGVLSNLLPGAVAIYNLALHFRQGRKMDGHAGGSGPSRDRRSCV